MDKMNQNVIPFQVSEYKGAIDTLEQKYYMHVRPFDNQIHQRTFREIKSFLTKFLTTTPFYGLMAITVVENESLGISLNFYDMICSNGTFNGSVFFRVDGDCMFKIVYRPNNVDRTYIFATEKI